jgi:toxin CptA
VLLVLAIVLAFVAGFALQRGGICAVAAVHELVSEGRSARFVSFLECAAWALIGLLIAHVAGWMSVSAWPQQTSLTMAALGGAVFGAGALLNGACAFGSAARFAAGEVSFLALIPGFVLGAAAGMGVGWGADMTPEAPAALALRGAGFAVLTLALTVFLVWRLWSAWRAAPTLVQTRTALAERDWHPALAMAVIAFANVALLLIVFAWPYTTLLVDFAFARGMDLVARTIIVIVFLAGAWWGAQSAERFAIRNADWRTYAARFGGGVLMGFGAALIPGGNDAHVLLGLPLLQPAAFVAYAMMVCVIALGFFAQNAGPKRV